MWSVDPDADINIYRNNHQRYHCNDIKKRCMSTNGLPTAALASHGLRSMRNHERGTTVSDKYINMYTQTNALPMAKVVPTGLVGSYRPRIRQLPNNALTATTDALTHFPLLDNRPR